MHLPPGETNQSAILGGGEAFEQVQLGGLEVQQPKDQLFACCPPPWWSRNEITTVQTPTGNGEGKHAAATVCGIHVLHGGFAESDLPVAMCGGFWDQPPWHLQLSSGRNSLGHHPLWLQVLLWKIPSCPLSSWATFEAGVRSLLFVRLYGAHHPIPLCAFSGGLGNDLWV